MSLNENYKEAFGFTIVQKLFDNLLPTRPIPAEVKRLTPNERRKHFIHAVFQKYDGFRFTSQSVEENVSRNLPISMVMHI